MICTIVAQNIAVKFLYILVYFVTNITTFAGLVSFSLISFSLKFRLNLYSADSFSSSL